jgi:heme/copper-type cytochrome/quinol oxidase subunit 2
LIFVAFLCLFYQFQADSALGLSQAVASTIYIASLTLMFATRQAFFGQLDQRPLLQVRGATGRDGPDLWVTNDPASILITIGWFTCISMAQLYLVANLLLKRPKYMARLHLKIGWVLPCSLFCLSSVSFMNYTKMSPYGASALEWSIAAFYSLALLGFTIVLLVRPITCYKRWRINDDK